MAGLLELWFRHRHELSGRYAQAVYLRGMLEAKKQEFNELMQEAEKGNIVEGVIDQAQAIQSEIEILTNQIDILAEEVPQQTIDHQP